jgi:hypothetical protein
MCLSYHMCFELISGFSHAHGYLAFMVWLQRGYRVCVWCLAVRELTMWSASGSMTGIKIVKGSLPFRVHLFETGCWFCAVPCPVLSGDCTTGSYAMVVSIYQAIRRRVPVGVLTPSWGPHISHYPGFLWFSSDSPEKLLVDILPSIWPQPFPLRYFFAWFQASATRYELFVMQRVIVVNYRRFGMTLVPTWRSQPFQEESFLLIILPLHCVRV